MSQFFVCFTIATLLASTVLCQPAGLVGHSQATTTTSSGGFTGNHGQINPSGGGFVGHSQIKPSSTGGMVGHGQVDQANNGGFVGHTSKLQRVARQVNLKPTSDGLVEVGGQTYSLQPVNRATEIVVSQPQSQTISLRAQQPATTINVQGQSQPQTVTLTQPRTNVVIEGNGDSYYNEAPTPYSFSWETNDDEGTRWGHSEQSGGDGVVTGSYQIESPYGYIRIVNYRADDDGFHVDIQSNEPGMSDSEPSNVVVRTFEAPAGALEAEAQAQAARAARYQQGYQTYQGYPGYQSYPGYPSFQG